MPRALIALGSNLGDRAQTLTRAIELLSQQSAITVLAHSAWAQTTPVGGPAGQDKFLNGAALLETTLEPLSLLHQLQRVETELGRRRETRWGPRTLDLDLLLYDDRSVDLAELEVPHPRLEYRRFVLEPAVEIAPEWRHPRIGWTLRQLLANLDESPPHVTLVGDDAAQLLRVAHAVAATWQARVVELAARTIELVDERLLFVRTWDRVSLPQSVPALQRCKLWVMLEAHAAHEQDATVRRHDRLAWIQRVHPGPVARIASVRDAAGDAAIIAELRATLDAL